jgi:hypothetical protein
MKTEIRKIGPAEAEELLLLNRRNRHSRPTHVARLAADMANGDWRNGSTILLADDGGVQLLLDGQHRLAAIVKSGVTVELVIISGLALDDQAAVDTGLRRGLADVLTLAGEKNSAALASAIGWYWRRQNGYTRTSQTPTVAQGLAVLRDNPGLRECFTSPRRAAEGLKISRGLAACLFYEQLAIDAEDAAAFWDMLATGLVPDQNPFHPIYLLHSKLEENAKAAYKRLDAISTAALIIKAWNAFVEGRDIRMLKWARGGASPEPFPELSAGAS